MWGIGRGVCRSMGRRGFIRGVSSSALLSWAGDCRSFYGVELVITVTVGFSEANGFPVLGAGLAGVGATIFVGRLS